MDVLGQQVALLAALCEELAHLLDGELGGLACLTVRWQLTQLSAPFVAEVLRASGVSSRTPAQTLARQTGCPRPPSGAARGGAPSAGQSRLFQPGHVGETRRGLGVADKPAVLRRACLVASRRVTPGLLVPAVSRSPCQASRRAASYCARPSAYASERCYGVALGGGVIRAEKTALSTGRCGSAIDRLSAAEVDRLPTDPWPLFSSSEPE